MEKEEGSLANDFNPFFEDFGEPYKQEEIY
jgi:hypothetical protein